MFNVVISAICRTASSLLWPATGMEGQESWRTFRLPEAVESVVVKRMFSSYSLKSSHLPSVPAPRSPDLDIDKDLSSSRLTTMAFRLAFARASTSATLVHVDINLISQRSQQKATTDTSKCGESVDLRFPSRPPPQQTRSSGQEWRARSGSTHRQGRPTTGACSTPPRKQEGYEERRCPLGPQPAREGEPCCPCDPGYWLIPCEQGIRANRPATGIERLACLQRLSLAIPT